MLNSLEGPEPYFFSSICRSTVVFHPSPRVESGFFMTRRKKIAPRYEATEEDCHKSLLLVIVLMPEMFFFFRRCSFFACYFLYPGNSIGEKNMEEIEFISKSGKDASCGEIDLALSESDKICSFLFHRFLQR